MARAFRPLPAATVNINVSSSSQNVALGLPAGEHQVLVTNDGTETVWINFGPSGVTASASTGMPVGAGVVQAITLPDYGAAPYIAAIAAGSTGRIYFTPGEGI